jgi:hypothetical protein
VVANGHCGPARDTVEFQHQGSSLANIPPPDDSFIHRFNLESRLAAESFGGVTFRLHLPEQRIERNYHNLFGARSGPNQARSTLSIDA